ncbi:MULTISPECIES: LLM class flavin-dependent oxidoreductase [unclassified Brenneria]|uniref:LLM class flavin-dependent oxidoreductase n=1 Tax=unclassified Brenneria TaxID=2634434 RepID=UPI0029C25D20|nr:MULTISPECIES: LLM class flavin-dependent oxidoreductase [unclassified Brenneria]MDX5628364.1 LLM class flavin-dependent oxidoreductase [Brenneria sp. L3-3Z]MDX5695453.1 LLM class flavin-dependent oxidoreductase [Brenneria sp. L4-2C]MEE3662302.1 LLM class flavin-dependent oxidoreductase [Brenneria sp. g21c3]
MTKQLTPLDYPDSPLSLAIRQPLMLGLFLPTQTGGFSQSTYPRETDWSFDYNAKLTLTAERHGFDFVFSLQQWVQKGGFGGEAHYRENFLDPFITTVALSSLTKRIITISTVNVLYGNLHPLYLARFAATADHIAQGRFGLNIVTGYDAKEPLMFGMTRPDHDTRYQQAGEFSQVMEILWHGEDNLTFNGQYYQLQQAYISPRPRYGRPIMVSASASPAGFHYAAQHSDIVFTSSPAGAVLDQALPALPAHTESIRAAYRKTGREAKIIIFPLIICRPTREEALAYRDAIVERADRESIAAYTARHSGGDAHGWKQHYPADRVLGGHIQIVGSPADVADALEQLHQAGIDGVQIGFYDYEPELAFFAAEVLPLLKIRGLRRDDQ